VTHVNRNIPSFFALTSIRPEKDQHFYMADYDFMMAVPRKTAFLYRTSPYHYHVIDFTEKLSLQQLIFRLKLMHVDRGFIQWVEKNGFAQLRLSHEFQTLHEGTYPSYPLKFMEVKFVNVTVKPA